MYNENKKKVTCAQRHTHSKFTQPTLFLYRLVHHLHLSLTSHTNLYVVEVPEEADTIISLAQLRLNEHLFSSYDFSLTEEF